MRQQGQYADMARSPYGASQMQHMPGQRMEHRSGSFQGRPEAMEGQWRWERDGAKVTESRSAQMFNEDKGGDVNRSVYHDQRLDSKLALEKQNNNDPGVQSYEEDMDIGYDNIPSDVPTSQTYEGLEQKFNDDLLKLSKEQADAEDSENARHMEKIKAINAHYQEQLGTLRTHHASRRDEILRRESHARRSQYQQAMMDNYSSRGIGPNDRHGYAGVASPGALDDPRRAYNSDNYDSYRERKHADRFCLVASLSTPHILDTITQKVNRYNRSKRGCKHSSTTPFCPHTSNSCCQLLELSDAITAPGTTSDWDYQ